MTKRPEYGESPEGEADVARDQGFRALLFDKSSFVDRPDEQRQKVNQFRNQHPDWNIDLSKSDFHRFALDGVNLAGLDLHNSNFTEASLSGTDLHSANLSGSSFEDACLIGADLRSAILIRTNLRGTKLSSADLRGANLDDYTLETADLAGSTVDRMMADRWLQIKRATLTIVG